METTTASIMMPDWFEFLCEQAEVVCTPKGHFGSAYATVEGNRIEVRSTTLGEWTLLITAQRKDPCAMHCDRRIEYEIYP